MAVKTTRRRLQIDQSEGIQPSLKPPGDFDPHKASQKELVDYSYPRRPPRANREALKIWRALVSGPLPLKLRILTGNVPDYQLSFSVPTSSGREETSRNWSGVVTHARGGNPFVSVFGMWQVPAVSAPPGTKNGEFRCSTWIGLDGTRRSLPSMPQIGTTQKVHVKKGKVKISFEAWSQWWSSAGVTHSQLFSGFPLNAGDVVACSIDVVSGLLVNLALTNVTLGTPIWRRSMVPIIIAMPNGSTIVLNSPVTGTTAEWIAERPRQFNPPMDLYRLPVFDRVTFTGATVTDQAGAQRGMGPVKVIRMVEPHAGSPARLHVLSRARKQYLPNGDEIAVAGPGLERQIGG